MTTTYPTPTPEQLAQAEELEATSRRNEQEAADSFARCDTDGFLSQWASDRMASLRRLEARLLRQGGYAEHAALFDLDGNLVPAKLIGTRYGMAWMLLDEDGRKTGKFVSAFPKRASTMERKGYREGSVLAESYAELVGQTHTSVHPVTLRKDRGWSRDVIVVDNGLR